MWKEKEATAALRAVIERQGLDPREYALHSGQIGALHVWQPWGCRRTTSSGKDVGRARQRECTLEPTKKPRLESPRHWHRVRWGKEYNQDNYVICKDGRIGRVLRSREKRGSRCLYEGGRKAGKET